jgi:hypothetical protein
MYYSSTMTTRYCPLKTEKVTSLAHPEQIVSARVILVMFYEAIDISSLYQERSKKKRHLD